MLPKSASSNSKTLVRGRVVDDHGVPLAEAVIKPLGVSTNELPDGTQSKGEVSLYGTIEGLDPAAVTNNAGEFEIAGRKPALGMLLKIEARGFAEKLEVLATGERRDISVYRGAVVRGRLMDHGTPVAGAEIGLMARNRGGFGGNLKVIGDPYEEIRVGTQPDGSFVLADVPAPVDWYLYAKMESLTKGRSTESAKCATKYPGEVVDAGELSVDAGHRLRGTILLSDGAKIADGMRVIIASDEAWDSQVVPLHPDGSFEVDGLPTGHYDISPSVRGYESLKPVRNLSVDHDISEFKMLLQPERQ